MVFDIICGERASFKCVTRDNGSAQPYIIEAFAGNNAGTNGSFLSIFANEADYISVTPMEEGDVTNGVINIGCRGVRTAA
jgi:hypothetical protein